MQVAHYAPSTLRECYARCSKHVIVRTAKEVSNTLHCPYWFESNRQNKLFRS